MNTVRNTLAAEAASAEERASTAPGRMHRSTSGSRGASQVYTIRMPVDRLEEIRRAAHELGEQPSALMRRWVLERLDAEKSLSPDAGLQDLRRSLTEALRIVDGIDDQRPA